MRLVKSLTCALLISVGIAGCASRRCCHCSCHRQTADQSESFATVENAISPIYWKISDEDIVRPEEVANNDQPVESAQSLIIDPMPAPVVEEMPITTTQVTPEPLPVEPPAIENKPRFELAKTQTLPQPVSEDDNNDAVYAHAEDYSWLKGRLQRVHVPGVEWKIRYMSIDEADQWGGSMVLAPDIRLEDFSDQDAVYIEGKQLENRPSLYISGPLYRIQKIRAQASVSEESENQ